MAKINSFAKIVDNYRRDADFVVVYIREAHPVEGWMIPGNKYRYNNHRNFQERADAAQMLIDAVPTLDVPVLVDNMRDEACLAYGAIPERLYIVLDGVIVFEGGWGPMHYDLGKMERRLNEILAGKKVA